MDDSGRPPTSAGTSLEKRLVAAEAENARLIAENALLRQQLSLQSSPGGHDEIHESLLGFFLLSLDLLCIANARGEFIRLNPEWEKMLGYPAAELIGRKFLEFVHPEDIDATAFALARLNSQEDVLNFENRYRCRDGSYRWIEWRSRSYGGLIYAAARDISRRKNGEEVLVRKDALLGAMLRNLPFDFWARDTDQRIILQSDVSVAFWGDLTSDTRFQSESDNQDFERWRLNNSRVLGGEMISEDCTYVSKDGESRDFHQIIAPIRDDVDILGILGINIDITEQKRVEEELRTSNELLASFISNSPIYAFIKEVSPGESRVLKASENFQEMIGIPGSEMAGKTMQELFPADFAEKITDDDWQVVARGEILRLEEELQGRFYTTIKFPIRLGGKNFLAGYTIDFTDRKRAEEEKEKLQAQLIQAQKMESVGRLAGGVAHDFNNMLGVILGHTELAMNRLEPEHPLFVSLQQIHKAAERSANLTRQLLAFARKQTVMPKVLDLNLTLEGMLTMVARLIGEDIDLVWIPGQNLPPVEMDPSQIDQVLVNLCVNARDAIGDTGKLTIETGVAAFDEAYCAGHAGFVAGEYVLLAVSDNGCGMEAAILGHLFEPFFTTKEVGKGTGLGLATVYGIVKQNRGFITVYSEPGQGTTFRIYLPPHATKAARLTRDEVEAPTEHGHETILLVEDEPMILDLSMDMLKTLGYTVLSATTPGEAIRLAQEHSGQIHLLLTDVVMPEMNGRDLARNLLSLYPELKRLFMSGYTANVIAHHGVLDAGVHFLQKPFSIGALAAKIREALQPA